MVQHQDEEIIKDYLTRISWLEFSRKLSDIFHINPLLTGPVAGLYEKVKKGMNTTEKIDVKLKNIFGPYILAFWSVLVSRVNYYFNIYKFNKKFPNVSTARDLKFKHYEFALLLTSTHPSLYDSIAKIAKKLDSMGYNVLILTNSSVYKEKYKELTSLKNSTCILLDYELKSLGRWDYLKSRKNAKQQFEQMLNYINDEIIKKMFIKYRDYLELFLMVENLYETIYSELFSKVKPKAIIANGFAGALLKVTKNMKIKRIMIQHGTQWGNDTPSVTPDVDELIIWGDFWKENFRRKMYPKVKLVPLGCPRFDEILEWKKRKKLDDNFYNKIGIDKRRAIVTFLSNTHGYRSNRFWESIIRGLEYLLNVYHPKINLIIKLHPQESKTLYLKILKRSTLNKIQFIRNEISLYELFLHTDIAITAGSTSMLEAMAFDIPVIQVNFSNEPEIIDFYKYGGGVLVKDKEELISTIFRILNDNKFRNWILQNQRKFLRRCLANLGRSTDVVVEYLVNSVIKNDDNNGGY